MGHRAFPAAPAPAGRPVEPRRGSNGVPSCPLQHYYEVPRAADSRVAPAHRSGTTFLDSLARLIDSNVAMHVSVPASGPLPDFTGGGIPHGGRRASQAPAISPEQHGAPAPGWDC